MKKSPAASTGSYLGIILLIISVIFIFVSATGCDKPETIPQVSLRKKSPLPENDTDLADKNIVKIAVAAIISPKETFQSYKDLLALISQRLDRPVKLVQRRTYQEINDLIRDNQIDAAFVCTGAYVAGHDDFGMNLLVAPMVGGATVYYSYIIVNRDSTINELEDLRGKKFAFTDPLSNTGKASPTKMLARIGETPENFFNETIYTYSHDSSIKAVAHKIVDGAAVDSLVWEYLKRENPQDTDQTRIIKKSTPYGIPPVVVAKGIDPSLKEKLLKIFLGIHKSSDGKEVLDKIMVDRFVQVDDRIYDSFRND